MARVEVGDRVCLLSQEEYSSNGFFRGPFAVVGKCVDVAPNGKYIVHFKTLNGKNGGKTLYLTNESMVRVGEIKYKRLNDLLSSYGTMVLKRILTEMEKK